MTDTDRSVEILPPAPDSDDSPVAIARRMAKAAVVSAMEALGAAHRQAIASLDEVIDEKLLGSGVDLPFEGAAEFHARTEDMRAKAKEQMAARSLMLADAFQRAAIADIASADTAVRRIRVAVVHARKDPDST